MQMKNDPKTNLSIEDIEEELRLLKRKISDSIEQFNSTTGLIAQITIDYRELNVIGKEYPDQLIPYIDTFIILKT